MKKSLLVVVMVLLASQVSYAEIACDDLLPVFDITQEECNLCPNREFLTYYPYWMFNSTRTSCSLKECPSGYMSADDMYEVTEALDTEFPYKMPDHHEWGRGCFSCDTPFLLRVSEEECRKCPNRVYNAKFRLCGFKSCPDKAPLLTEFGGCANCNYWHRDFVIAGREKCQTDKKQIGFNEGSK